MLCGKQKGTPDPSWRLSIYCAQVECIEGVLFFHSMTGELLLFSTEERQRLSTDASLRREMAESGFLSPRMFVMM